MEVMGDNSPPEVALHSTPEARYTPSVESDHKPILIEASTKRKRNWRLFWSGWPKRRQWWTAAGVVGLILILALSLIVGLVLMKHKPNSKTSADSNDSSNTSNISNTYNISNTSNNLNSTSSSSSSSSSNSNTNNSNSSNHKSNNSNNSNTSNNSGSKTSDASNNSNGSNNPNTSNSNSNADHGSNTSNSNSSPNTSSDTSKSPVQEPSQETATHSSTTQTKCKRRFGQPYLPPGPDGREHISSPDSRQSADTRFTMAGTGSR
ncbi:hypothetical protein QBC44DRAFT_312968 [Cladorrhinum sp. PSN332]|nr:hypothetical protein QBC44DRAFT_312968 [Cladorrhinum sp. PSN332]